MNCSNCGGEVKPGEKFCGKCGEEVQLQGVFCLGCGTKADPKDSYCRACGSPINQATEPASEDLEGPETDEEEDFVEEDFDYRLDYDQLYDEGAKYTGKDKKKGGLAGGLSISESLSKAKFKLEELGKLTDKEDDKGIDQPSKKDVQGQAEPRHSQDDQERSQASRTDFTSKLPKITEDRYEERRVLAEDKRRSYEESLEKAKNKEDFLIAEPTEADSNMDETQKIDLAELRKIETEIRRVRKPSKSEGQEAQGAKNLDSEKKTRIKDQAGKDHSGPKIKSGADPAVKEDKIGDRAEDPARGQGLGGQPPVNDGQAQARSGPSRPSNTIIVLLVLLILAIGLAIASVLYFKTSKSSVISSFEVAASQGDLDQIREHVQAADGRTIQEEEAQALVDLMKSNKLFRSALIGAIKEDANKLNKDDSYVSTRPYRLEDVGSKYLIFDDYKIILDPINTSIQADESVSYSFAGSDYKGTTSDLSLLPGAYPLAIPSAGFEDKVNICSTSRNYQDGQVLLDLARLDLLVEDPVEESVEEEGQETEQTSEETEKETERRDYSGSVQIHLYADEEAMVLINGQETGLTVANFNALEGVDLKEGDLVQISQELPWTQARSQSQAYQGQEAMEFYVDYNNEETMEILMDKAVLMLKEDQEARSTRSMDPYTTLIEPELSTSQSMIDSENYGDVIYYRDYKTMAFDPDSLEVYPNWDGSYSAYVGGLLTYEAAEVAPRDLARVQGQDMEDLRGFHFTYLPEEGWFVNLWGYTERYINTENLIEREI